MKRLLLLFLGAALLLALVVGCGDEREPLEPAPADSSFRMLMSNPHQGQFNLPLTSQLVVYMSAEVDPASIVNRVFLANEDGFRPAIEVEVYLASIIITSVSHWPERTDYTITLKPGIRSRAGDVLKEERTIQFQTGLRRPKAAERLNVVRTVPGEDDPCWDFHTFRVFFNEPVDRDSVEYGKSFLFIHVASGDPVPGNLFARAGQLVFDPDEDLTAGETYQLTVTQEMFDANGDNLAVPFHAQFVPLSTGEHTLLAMDKCPTAVPGFGFCDALPDDGAYPKSQIIPYPMNSMYTKSVFLGVTNMLIGGRLWNEFGDAKLSPDRIPFVVRKGQKLIGKPLQYKVGGVIPSGILTGEIQITLLTDAVGEMLGSEFVHGEAGLPATITLFLDAAMTLENTTANSLLPQPLLGTKLVGVASVDLIDPESGYEAMKIELVGYSELNLGNERMPVAMALQMVPPPTLPEQEFDTTPPFVTAVSPVDMVIDDIDISDVVDTRMAGEKIIVYFSEPLDPDTVRDNIYVLGPEGRVSVKYDLYQPKMFLIPDYPLEPDTTYQIIVEPGIEDIVGNKLATGSTYSFTTMPLQSSPVDPPVVLAAVPELRPNSTMASNFLPEFYFSQIIDLDSLVYGDAYGLYDMTEGGELIPGTHVSYSVFFDFVPDSELIVGHHYRWVITEGATNLDGVALDTDMDREPGGPPIEIDFVVTPYSPFSQTVFMTYPYADTNANGYLDPEETPTKTNTMIMDSPLIKDPAYVLGFFPINVHGLVYGEQNEARLPVNVAPNGYQFATSISVSLGGKTDPPGLLDMGRMLIQLQPGSATDIIRGEDGKLASDTDIIMSFNVENSLLNSFLVHDMFLQIPSVVRYSQDGRMITVIRGQTMAGMVIPVLGVMDIPVAVDLVSSTVPTTRGF
ncbi:MAG: Ig-like domain-containing protein [Candidatus Lernaella stagnicola]|nr:Ig-like domain-containing protein [Candidatus Lernaella stagnicola]